MTDRNFTDPNHVSHRNRIAGLYAINITVWLKRRFVQVRCIPIIVPFVWTDDQHAYLQMSNVYMGQLMR